MNNQNQNGMNKNNDYSVDSVKSYPMELKGNSAEGNPVDMHGFGSTATPGRDNVALTEGGGDALGAFVQGKSASNQSL